MIEAYIKQKRDAEDIIEGMKQACDLLFDFVGDPTPMAQSLMIETLEVINRQVDTIRVLNSAMVMTKGTPAFKEKGN